jgi:hypothetical protein
MQERLERSLVLACQRGVCVTQPLNVLAGQ